MKFLIALSFLVTASAFADAGNKEVKCYEPAQQGGHRRIAYILQESRGMIYVTYPDRLQGPLKLNYEGCLAQPNGGGTTGGYVGGTSGGTTGSYTGGTTGGTTGNTSGRIQTGTAGGAISGIASTPRDSLELCPTQGQELHRLIPFEASVGRYDDTVYCERSIRDWFEADVVQK